MGDIGRNEPCPCGSGKKYKHCHWGKPLPGEGSSEGSGRDDGHFGVGGEQMSTGRIVLFAGLAIVALSVALTFLVSARVGYSVGGTLGFATLMWAAWRKPPPVRDNTSDSAAINFGKPSNSP